MNFNGIEVVREGVDGWDHDDIHGCVVGLPVLNVPGFITQERYLPIYERDLNRAFPGKEESTSAYRIAHRIYTNFSSPVRFRDRFPHLDAWPDEYVPRASRHGERDSRATGPRVRVARDNRR